MLYKEAGIAFNKARFCSILHTSEVPRVSGVILDIPFFRLGILILFFSLYVLKPYLVDVEVVGSCQQGICKR